MKRVLYIICGASLGLASVPANAGITDVSVIGGGSNFGAAVASLNANAVAACSQLGGTFIDVLEIEVLEWESFRTVLGGVAQCDVP